MATVLEPRPSLLRPPREALRRLAQVSPSDRALAEMLGTDNHTVAGWRNGVRRMRRPFVDVVPSIDALVDRLLEAGVLAEDVPYLLRRDWAPLDAKRPAVALKSGYELDQVIDAVPVVLGEPAAPLLDSDAQMLVDWFAGVMSQEPEAAAADDDDDDEGVGEAPAAAWLSEAWRGGATMSSDRWFRR